MSARAPRRILVCALLPIGDTLFTTPAIHALHVRYPTAHITALVYPTNGGILAANPEVDTIWLAPTRERWRELPQVAVLARNLRATHFDLAVEFSAGNYGIRWWAGVRRRATIEMPALWWVRPGAGRAWRRLHAVEHYALVVRQAGIPIPDWRLRVYATAAEVAARDQLLRDHGVRPAEPIVGIHPGGEGLWGQKKWSRRGFADVATALHQEFGVKIVVLGGKEDARLAAEVAALSRAPVLNLAGQTTLGATAAVAARCTIFVGNDSSPLHIAAAAGTPVVGIYGLTDPRSYRPWVPGGQEGRDYAIVRSPAPCAACFSLIGGNTLLEMAACLRCRALAAVTPAQVLDAARPLLAARLA